MSSATLVFQEYKWPAFKVLSVLFLAFLFLSGSGWWGVIFDQQVILPFASLLVAPLLYALFRRENPVWALIAASVPAGVATGAINLTTPLIWLETPEGAVASPIVYSPIALGLILSYGLRVIAPAYQHNSAKTDAVKLWSWLVVTVACITSYLLGTLEGADIFARSTSLLFMLAVTLCCFAFNDQARLTSGEVMARAGLMTCLLAAVYSVTLYTAGAAINDPKLIGPALADSQTMMLYGALILVAAGALGVRPAEDRDLLTRDWHLTEAYVFITLIVFPPQTLLELLNESMG
tara:strand:- start:169 stop:1044 length:876 start_codon:yes stop_codon:yes gene_type:complete